MVIWMHSPKLRRLVRSSPFPTQLHRPYIRWTRFECDWRLIILRFSWLCNKFEPSSPRALVSFLNLYTGSLIRGGGRRWGQRNDGMWLCYGPHLNSESHLLQLRLTQRFELDNFNIYFPIPLISHTHRQGGYEYRDNVCKCHCECSFH